MHGGTSTGRVGGVEGSVMQRRRGFAAVIAAVLLITQVAGVAAAAGAGTSSSASGTAAPIEGKLQRDLAGGKAKKIVVEFRAKADLKPAAKVKDRAKRGQAVIDALTSTAGTSQRAAAAVAAKARGVTATTYWLTNVLVVEGDPATLSKLATTLAKDPRGRADPRRAQLSARRADRAEGRDPRGRRRPRVGRREDRRRRGLGRRHPRPGRRRRHDRHRRRLHPSRARRPLPRQQRRRRRSPTTTTGGTRPGIVPRRSPATTSAHGTHTMGTIVGGDGPGPFTPDIGVAPGAQWIAAKGCEDFGCSEESLLSSGPVHPRPDRPQRREPRPVASAPTS